ncbi:MAG: Gfo/Idh/MocA family oxidoreductase [Candidatus Omnitrophica bacterium]|nr:Gfo/Idh/MocA family oxidoreductase [Candidatus Omnitrophota bacterium]
MLKPEELKVGRRNFMKAAAVLPAAGAYVATAKIAEPVKCAWIGTGGEGRVLLENCPYNGFIEVVAVADIRPDFRELGAHIVRQKCCPDVRAYSNYKDMLSDGGFEAVVIATPLLTHGPITMDCLSAGYHVLCEKTMAYSIDDCEGMINAAKKNNLVLAIGHQRHANPLYITTKEMVDTGMLGEVHHIRSLWHRNHSWRRSPAGEWNNEVLKEKFGEYPIEGVAKILGITGENAKNPNIVMREGGKEDAPFYTEQKQFELYFQYLAEKEPEFEAKIHDTSEYGYESPDMLGNWRLYKKMSHGLMSELGSHQIDVCNWMWGAEPDYVS